MRREPLLLSRGVFFFEKMFECEYFYPQTVNIVENKNEVLHIKEMLTTSRWGFFSCFLWIMWKTA